MIIVGNEVWGQGEEVVFLLDPLGIIGWRTGKGC
jgi:hypothetical protein